MGRSAATASMILFAILAFAAFSASSAAAVDTTHLSPEGHDKKLSFPIDPVVKRCWNAFSLVPGCVDEIFRSFASGSIRIGPACCKVINKFAYKCLPRFTGFFYPFNPFLAPAIKALCR
ncbi:hypothetical protein H6P81_017570 [Aristolochia fimbriata]|uniref:Prolamin-like domain-containing protein n=1 Tax=Aristolochia fimbriata TaxID=158543 RepID=A0AAV7E1E2_ARIFI|nr:hypothetical protein H6P81_017568 [Aristolochia fimbriata]KAG9441716.1 hypothetical protein H6P81_017570 [Aristolochia fimbriata]